MNQMPQRNKIPDQYLTQATHVSVQLSRCLSVLGLVSDRPASITEPAVSKRCNATALCAATCSDAPQMPRILGFWNASAFPLVKVQGKLASCLSPSKVVVREQLRRQSLRMHPAVLVQ